MFAAPPPYSLAPPEFPFRALAALAGRAALGGERETAIGALVVARLAAAALPPDSLPIEARAERAKAARSWLSALALPAGMRAPLSRVVEATAGDALAAIATALDRATEAAGRHLDAAATAELTALARALRA